MGNRFGARTLGVEVNMNNGSTDVFCDVIALAGSPLARTTWQQNLVLHFCDTSRASRGFAGFDLDDLPWTADHRAEQDFFLDLLDRATARTAWHHLTYTPAIDHHLAAFTHLLTAFRPTPTPPSPLGDWTTPPNPSSLELCTHHPVFHGYYRCRLCDTSIQPA
ncbi:hypothetical protein [Nocardia sp. NPDC058666]|uniref:hypothetical protein n=1 Tax=unclassified Nocardia TaxID=2637762 RepID=UPI0036528E01